MNSWQPEQPIGIFDSGIGGLTVANAIIKRMPDESMIYFGDTAHLPYGDKSADAIRYYSLRIGKFLLDAGAKMIVIACNSASSAAYEVLVDFFKDQALFVNVVDPLVQFTVRQQYRKVGVIATRATIHSQIYERKLKELQPEMDVFSMATPLLVPMIEEGFYKNELSRPVINSYLSHPGFEGIDAILLACTHYPLIKDHIQEFFGPGVAVIDSTQVVEDEVYGLLSRQGLLSPASGEKTRRFYVSDYTPSFEETTRLFYGSEIHLEHYPM